MHKDGDCFLLATRTFVASAAAMKTVAALMNDPNPIHWDVNAVREMGLGDKPVNQGPVTISYLMTLAIQVLGSASAFQKFDARFLANVLAGDEVICEAWLWPQVGETTDTTLKLLASVRGRPVASARCRAVGAPVAYGLTVPASR